MKQLYDPQGILGASEKLRTNKIKCVYAYISTLFLQQQYQQGPEIYILGVLKIPILLEFPLHLFDKHRHQLCS